MQWLRRAVEQWIPDDFEDRTLAPPSMDPHLPLMTSAPMADVTTSNALHLADAFACVKTLSDAVASLPLHAYRHTAQGRVPAGPDARISRLLARPAPGSTIADLTSLIMVHLATLGECFVGKYRGADGEIVQIGLIHPASIDVELRGQRIVYRLLDRGVEVGPSDVLHIKGMTGADGLRGLSPVTAARLTLQLNSSLQTSATALAANDGRPSGVLKVAGPQGEAAIETLRSNWDLRHGGPLASGRVAVVSGDVTFSPVSFSAMDQQFLQQRELSTREVCRIFSVPAWMIGGSTADSLTYATVAEQARAFVTFSLRPWLVRIERALSSDADLCPGTAYCEFGLDALLRADAGGRAAVYTQALNPTTGWLQRSEVRALEDLPPEVGESPAPAPPEEDTTDA